MTIHETADSLVVQSHEEAQDYLDLSDQEAIAALPQDIREDLLTEYNEESVPAEDDYWLAGSVLELPDDYANQIDLLQDG